MIYSNQYPLPHDKPLEETSKREISIDTLRKVVEYWNGEIDKNNLSVDKI